MSKKNITLRVEAELYSTFRELCDKEGWIASRQFEVFMDEKIRCYTYIPPKTILINLKKRGELWNTTQMEDKLNGKKN